jgi:hypothetical protein
MMKREVELLVLFARGLVDRDDDRLALPLGQVGQKVDQRHGVVRGEARGGLVEKHQRGVGHQLQGDVHALALAAGEHLLLGLSDLEVLDRLEPEVFDGLIDAASRSLGRCSRGRLNFALYRDRLLHRELGVHDVVLRARTRCEPRSAS